MLEYRMLDEDDAHAQGLLDEDDVGWGDPCNYIFLFDNDEMIRWIASDNGEPEDQTFRRNYHWIVDELNSALNTRQVQ